MRQKHGGAGAGGELGLSWSRTISRGDARGRGFLSETRDEARPEERVRRARAGGIGIPRARVRYFAAGKTRDSAAAPKHVTCRREKILSSERTDPNNLSGWAGLFPRAALFASRGDR